MNLQLQGLRVLNTRPIKQGRDLSRKIKKAGGTAIDYPALVIKPTDKNSFPVQFDLQKANIAIFTSPNAVEYAFKVQPQMASTWPNSIQVIAIGQATAAALNQHQIQVHYIPNIKSSEHLIQLPPLQEVTDQYILLFKGVGGLTLIEETLIQRQAKLTVLEVYKRDMPQENKEDLNSIWRNDAVDIILFTSEQAMHQLKKMLGPEATAWLCSKPCLVISQRLADSALKLGIAQIIVSSPEKIFDTLCDYNQGLIHGQ